MTYAFPTPPAGPRTPRRDGGLVAVAYTADPARAHILRSVLEAEGIPAAVLGEHAASAFAAAFASMVSVQVPRALYARAAEALTRRITNLDDPQHEPVRPARCPACGYDLAGLADEADCPECGQDPMLMDLLRGVTIAPPPPSERTTRFVHALGIGFGLLVAAVMVMMLLGALLGG